MLEHRLTLKYKGDRSYLHGSDIFNASLAWLNDQRSDIRDLDFAFHRIASRQLKICLGTIPDDNIKPTAICTFTSEHGREQAFLLETDQQVAGCYLYPEDEIVNSMQLDLESRCGRLGGSNEYSDIETWIAMTKALHYQVFPHLKGKWLFVRGRFPKYVPKTEMMERTLTIAASFNDKLTRSEAFGDGVKVGEIYFAIA